MTESEMNKILNRMNASKWEDIFHQIVAKSYDSYMYNMYIFDEFTLTNEEKEYVYAHDMDFMEIGEFVDQIYFEYDKWFFTKEEFENEYNKEIADAFDLLNKVFDIINTPSKYEMPKDPELESMSKISEFAMQSAMRSHSDIKAIMQMKSEHVKKFWSISERLAQRFKDFVNNY